MIPLWFVPFALACGNAIILKPSERDPLPSEEIFRILEKLDLPKGLVSLLHGGRETVQAILEERAIDAISFVGQASTARTIATEGVRHGKRVQALGGAKNSAILMPDAKLDQAVPAVLSSAFEAAGQRCLASSVLIVVGSKKEREASIDRVLQASKKLKSGNGKSKTTDVCPLISPEARERAIRAIREAEASGAKVLLDGRNVGNDAGTLLGPTLVASQRPEIALFKEEIFAPVLAVYEAETLEEAIRFSNETEYGNSGAIFTESAAAVREYKRGIAAGMLGVNIGVPAPIAWFPFAGHKASIDGDLHANGIDAVEFYTRKKVVTSRWQ